MTKPDDSTLHAADLKAVEARARLSLDKAAAWGRFPTPVDDILSAAKLRVAPKGMFDVASYLAYAGTCQGSCRPCYVFSGPAAWSRSRLR